MKKIQFQVRTQYHFKTLQKKIFNFRYKSTLTWKMPYALIAVFVKVPISVEIFYASNIIVDPVGILNMQMTPWNITNRLWEIVELIQIVPAIITMAIITLIPKKVMLLCPKCHPLKIISKLKHVLHVNFWDDLSVLYILERDSIDMVIRAIQATYTLPLCAQ